MSELTQASLRAMLSYDSNTGVFRWLSHSRRSRVGEAAGWKNSCGHIRIDIAATKYYAHRLAWLYIHGRWPSEVLDHIDGNPSNNSLSNLREATRTQNNLNRKVGGVVRDKRRVLRPFYARLQVGGKRLNLGTFATEEAARDAYITANLKHFGAFSGFRRGGEQ